MNNPRNNAPDRSNLPIGWGFDSPLVFTPDGLEERYAYPVLVVLQPVDQSLEQFHETLNRISERNYVGLCIPVTSRLFIDRQRLHDTIAEAIYQTGRFINLHSERITVVGAGELGWRAVEIVLQNPAAYSGFVTINTNWQVNEPKLQLFRDLQHLRGLILQQDRQVSCPIESIQLLKSAGIEIRFATYSADSPVNAARSIDRFIMQGIYQSQLQLT